MKQPVLFIISLVALALAIGGLIMRFKGYAYGDFVFWTGLIIYFLNRLAFYNLIRKNRNKAKEENQNP